MKKTSLIAGAIVVGWLLIFASSTFAGSMGKTFSGQGRGAMQSAVHTNSGSLGSRYATFGTHISRTVVNTASGVEITLTTTDPATLEHMKAMNAGNIGKTSRNTAIKTERTALPNGTKLTITGADTNTVKLIQEKANAAKSGAFGNAGQGKNGMGQGKGMKQGNGQGMRQGGGRAGCTR